MGLSKSSYIFCALLLLSALPLISIAEIITFGNGKKVQGRIGDLSENGVKFYSDKYYVYDLDDIALVEVDEGLAGEDLKQQKDTIRKLNRVIDRESHRKAQLGKSLRLFLQAGKYDQLDSVAKTIRSEQRKYPSGAWMLESFYIELKSDLQGKPPTAFRQRLAQVEAWIKQKPDSVTAKVARMAVLRDLAWAYRQSGNYSTVSDSDRQKFKATLQQVVGIGKILIDTDVPEPMSYVYLISALNALGVDKKTIRSLALQSLKHTPGFRVGLEAAMFSLVPKWGGGVEDAAAMLESAWDKYDGSDQTLYFEVIRQFKPSIEDRQYPYYGFDWLKINDSFLAYRKTRSVVDGDLHLMAKLAALHGDAALALEYLSETNGQWNHYAKKVWQNQEKLAYFKQWANQDFSPDFIRIMVMFAGGKTALVAAILEKLIDAGQQLDQTDIFGNTMLHLAIESDNTALVKKLLDAGASHQLANADGLMPVHLAAYNATADTLRLLVEAGADPLDRTARGKSTTLHIVSASGYLASANYLLEQAPSLLNTTNSQQATPLHNAAANGHIEMVRLLLGQKEMMADAQDTDGNTPVFGAINRGYDDIVRLLIESGESADIQNMQRHTPLSFARERGEVRIVEFLESMGAKDSPGAITDEDIAQSKSLEERGVKLASAEGFNKSVRLLERAIKANPNNASALQALAGVHWQYTGELVEADKLIHRAIELLPNHAELYYMAGRINHLLNKPEVYKKYFTRYVAMSPDTYNAQDLKRNYPQFLQQGIREELSVQSILSKISKLLSSPEAIWIARGVAVILVIGLGVFLLSAGRRKPKIV